MADNGMREFQEEQAAQQAQTEGAEVEADASPIVTPAAASALLSSPMAGVQRRALVQTLGQQYSNQQIQRMLGAVRRSASSGPEGGPLEEDLSARIQSERSNGQPLETNVRREVEQSLGQDLSPVRVHTGSSAAELNKQMGAKAFTSGRDIFYGEGTSPSDLDLTTHEATHTVQQGFGESAPSSIGAADTAHEHAAEHNASNAGAAVGAGVQREGDEEELAMKRDAAVQREGDEEELAMKRDDAVQRHGQEEVAMMRDSSVQREGDEEELAMKRDDAVQREGDEEELAMMRDNSVQREGDEEELAMKRDEAVQREGEEEDMAM